MCELVVCVTTTSTSIDVATAGSTTGSSASGAAIGTVSLGHNVKLGETEASCDERVLWERGYKLCDNVYAGSESPNYCNADMVIYIAP